MHATHGPACCCDLSHLTHHPSCDTLLAPGQLLAGWPADAASRERPPAGPRPDEPRTRFTPRSKYGLLKLGTGMGDGGGGTWRTNRWGAALRPVRPEKLDPYEFYQLILDHGPDAAWDEHARRLLATASPDDGGADVDDDISAWASTTTTPTALGQQPRPTRRHAYTPRPRLFRGAGASCATSEEEEEATSDAAGGFADPGAHARACVHGSPGLRRAVVPKLYALESWSPRLSERLLPKYLLAFDSVCTAHFYRCLRRLAPQPTNARSSSSSNESGGSGSFSAEDGEPTASAEAAAVAVATKEEGEEDEGGGGTAARAERARFSLMVRAAGAALAHKLTSLSPDALAAIPDGLASVRYLLRDTRTLCAWEAAVTGRCERSAAAAASPPYLPSSSAPAAAAAPPSPPSSSAPSASFTFPAAAAAASPSSSFAADKASASSPLPRSLRASHLSSIASSLGALGWLPGSRFRRAFFACVRLRLGSFTHAQLCELLRGMGALGLAGDDDSVDDDVSDGGGGGSGSSEGQHAGRGRDGRMEGATEESQGAVEAAGAARRAPLSRLLARRARALLAPQDPASGGHATAALVWAAGTAAAAAAAASAASTGTAVAADTHAAVAGNRAAAAARGTASTSTGSQGAAAAAAAADTDGAAAGVARSMADLPHGCLAWHCARLGRLAAECPALLTPSHRVEAMEALATLKACGRLPRDARAPARALATQLAVDLGGGGAARAGLPQHAELLARACASCAALRLPAHTLGGLPAHTLAATRAHAARVSGAHLARLSRALEIWIDSSGAPLPPAWRAAVLLRTSPPRALSGCTADELSHLLRALLAMPVAPPPPAPTGSAAGSAAGASEGVVAATGAGALPRSVLGASAGAHVGTASVDGVPLPPRWVEAVLTELLERCDRRANTTAGGGSKVGSSDRSSSSSGNSDSSAGGSGANGSSSGSSGGSGDTCGTGRWLAPRASPRPPRLPPDELAALLALLLLGSHAVAVRDALPIVVRRPTGRKLLLALRARCVGQVGAAAELSAATREQAALSPEPPTPPSASQARDPADWLLLVAALGEGLGDGGSGGS
ncbi:hypothetical protein FOA52_001009 [Chlamydomonas sp. UWO 241]|nr:hypothetical protein FOA52_001009 [Chlamydomonas sp. UWO 241]